MSGERSGEGFASLFPTPLRFGRCSPPSNTSAQSTRSAFVASPGRHDQSPQAPSARANSPSAISAESRSATAAPPTHIRACVLQAVSRAPESRAPVDPESPKYCCGTRCQLGVSLFQTHHQRAATRLHSCPDQTSSEWHSPPPHRSRAATRLSLKTANSDGTASGPIHPTPAQHPHAKSRATDPSSYASLGIVGLACAPSMCRAIHALTGKVSGSLSWREFTPDGWQEM